jgi:enoyl-CoA hydratase/carnithine racemase
MASVEMDVLEAGIARITMNRPDRLNSIDGSLIDGIEEAFDELEGDGETRAIILTGAGRGFCSGADLTGTSQAWVPTGRTFMKTMYNMQLRLTDLMTRMYESPIPTIAAVNGVAVGGGLAFALHCDIRIGSTTARFGSAFIKAGLSSLDMGTSYLLPKIVGAGRAREMMMTGRIIDASESERIGLVHEIVEPDQLVEACLRMARSITVNNEFGVWQTKIGLNATLDAPSLRHAKEIENRTQILCSMTPNAREAATAHMEKRPPNFERM